ncbi:hypothetical protein [Exiguobacterium aurantiacum]|uniref:Uncharacterized protein n=1 Tax=Exiguobacterium aurantiacum TaxID=33987 RepID=A0A377FRK5_9BACL|nr:hypothetical protein [Exiguobacterium aurantiacum]STO07461.1 Uncharacterised protein [Exiguobacterium aurantiacum]
MIRYKINSSDGQAWENYRAAESDFKDLMFYGQKLSKREKTMLLLKLDELLDASMVYHQQMGREQSKR